MEHQGEIWKEVDYNGEQVGSIDPNNYDPDKIKLFAGVNIMLYRKVDNDIEFLFQHRSKYIIGNADKWDTSAGGHINIGEKNIEAVIREANEEIGVAVDKDKLEFCMTYSRDKSFIVLYFYDYTGHEDDFCFNDKEVEEVKWVKASELNTFWPNLKPQLGCDDLFKTALDVKIKTLQK